MRTSLQNLSFIPWRSAEAHAGRRNWPRQALAETRYYEFGLKEKAINEDLQATLNQRFCSRQRMLIKRGTILMTTLLEMAGEL